MNLSILPYSNKYLNEVKALADNNNDVLKPNTKMLYFIVARLFTNISYVALVNNDVIGFIVSFKNGNRIWLHQLAVDKEFRGKGIGNSLITKIESVSNDCEIEFSVKENNHKAIKLYEKLGYEKDQFNAEIEQIIYKKKL
jgi:ribosomal protein S18 acetylase RimI-like enzyme